MSINEKLEKLYESHWDNLLDKEKLLTEKLHTNPLLLKVNEEQYESSKLKVMIFGQETWGWHKFSTPIKKEMELYENFFIKEGFYDGYGKSAFWKAFRFFQNKINEHYNTEGMYIWNNISKIGRNDGKTGVTENIRKLERESFAVIQAEIDILKPDISIFFTGPNRDHDIKFHFKDLTIEHSATSSKTRELAKIASKELPECSLRMYHPAFYKGFNKELKSNAIKMLTNACTRTK